MASLPMDTGTTIQERKKKIADLQENWTLYAPLLSLLLALGPAIIAIQEAQAKKPKEKNIVAKKWTKWHITSAVLGASAAIVPAWISYNELKIKKLEKGMGV